MAAAWFPANTTTEPSSTLAVTIGTAMGAAASAGIAMPDNIVAKRSLLLNPANTRKSPIRHSSQAPCMPELQFHVQSIMPK
jgi:hypothetical protein